MIVILFLVAIFTAWALVRVVDEIAMQILERRKPSIAHRQRMRRHADARRERFHAVRWPQR